MFFFLYVRADQSMFGFGGSCGSGGLSWSSFKHNVGVVICERFIERDSEPQVSPRAPSQQPTAPQCLGRVKCMGHTCEYAFVTPSSSPSARYLILITPSDRLKKV